MTRPYLGNPKYTIEVLQKYNFAFQKRFGQNFLIDTHVLEKIIEASKITKDDFVLEIGPGIGTMTQYLAEAAREVVAVEIDKTLIPILENDTLKDWDNVTVINEDILKVDIAALAQEKLLAPESRSRHKLIGQLFDTYWLVEFENQFYIIDRTRSFICSSLPHKVKHCIQGFGNITSISHI